MDVVILVNIFLIGEKLLQNNNGKFQLKTIPPWELKYQKHNIKYYYIIFIFSSKFSIFI